jgi:hypothetical protein
MPPGTFPRAAALPRTIMPGCAAMIARGQNGKNITHINYLVEWSAAIAAIAFVLGVTLATVRVSPAQNIAQQPALQKPSDAGKPSSSLPSTGENLSDRLDRSDGVIKPPSGVDPQMHVAPKDSGRDSNMPVIPPPTGSVEPK